MELITKTRIYSRSVLYPIWYNLVTSLSFKTMFNILCKCIASNSGLIDRETSSYAGTIVYAIIMC